MKIILEHLTKKYPARGKKGGEVIAVNDFSFEIPDGELIGLLGPSGCGKSTTLNLISGLQKPTDGKIFFGEDDVTDLPPEHRGVGLVFQNYALYPHLTVLQNIMFPLENLKGKNKLSKEDMKKRAYEAAKLVQIEDYMERRPSELSGGQQQRVLLCRALCSADKMLVLDEPAAGLDTASTDELYRAIARLHREGVTILMVSHDLQAALEYATHVLHVGKPAFFGTKEDYRAKLFASSEKGESDDGMA